MNRLFKGYFDPGMPLDWPVRVLAQQTLPFRRLSNSDWHGLDTLCQRDPVHLTAPIGQR